MIDAFGIDRCLWGTDWTRAINFLTFKQGVDAFRATEPHLRQRQGEADGRQYGPRSTVGRRPRPEGTGYARRAGAFGR